MNYTVKLSLVRFEVSHPKEQVTYLRGKHGSKLAAALARQIIPDDGREHFGIFMLGARGRVLHYHEVTIGTVNVTFVEPREIFGAALRMLGVRAIVLVHNHPFSWPKPSATDLKLTRMLVAVGRMLDMPVLDHIIVSHADGTYTSFMESGWITPKSRRPRAVQSNSSHDYSGMTPGRGVRLHSKIAKRDDIKIARLEELLGQKSILARIAANAKKEQRATATPAPGTFNPPRIRSRKEK